MFHFLGTEYGLQNMAISFGLLVLQLFDLEFFQGDRGYVEQVVPETKLKVGQNAGKDTVVDL